MPVKALVTIKKYKKYTNIYLTSLEIYFVLHERDVSNLIFFTILSSQFLEYLSDGKIILSSTSSNPFPRGLNTASEAVVTHRNFPPARRVQVSVSASLPPSLCSRKRRKTNKKTRKLSRVPSREASSECRSQLCLPHPITRLKVYDVTHDVTGVPRVRCC